MALRSIKNAHTANRGTRHLGLNSWRKNDQTQHSLYLQRPAALGHVRLLRTAAGRHAEPRPDGARRACASSRPSPASRSAARRAPACRRASTPPKSAVTPTTGCCRWTRRPSAHWFAENGYEVGYIGKWHLASLRPARRPRRLPRQARAARTARRLRGLLAGLRHAGVHIAQLRRAHVRRRT